MNKNGFTMIELLAVIVILVLIFAIFTPAVTKMLGDSEDTLEEQQINNVVNATKKYMIEHTELLPDNSVCIGIDELINNGVIDSDVVINPKTKEELNGCVMVSYNVNFNQYEYFYNDYE